MTCTEVLCRLPLHSSAILPVKKSVPAPSSRNVAASSDQLFLWDARVRLVSPLRSRSLRVHNSDVGASHKQGNGETIHDLAVVWTNRAAVAIDVLRSVALSETGQDHKPSL